MQMTSREVNALRSATTVQGYRAPREMVIALLSLAPEVSPDDVFVSLKWGDPPNRTDSQWAILARHAGGLAVVTGHSAGAWDWRESAPPDGFTYSATWLPLRMVTGLSVSEVRYQSDYEANLWVDQEWALLFPHREPVPLYLQAETEDLNAQLAWLRRLQADLGA